MSSRPTWNTWEGGTGDEGTELPRRPSVDDLGGDTKLDNYEEPPDDAEHFTAQGWNQLVKQVAALARVTPAAKLEVRFNSGAPYIARVASPRADVAPSTFTPTDHGAGDVSITWPADTFPPTVCSPTGLTLLSNAGAVVDGHVEEIANGIRVRTRSGGVAADVPWTITLN
jgi:hypothetical protein